jgi:proline-specific peptidase
MITTTTGFAATTQGQLWWKRLDPGNDAVPLVLLHGGPGMASWYLEPLEALATDRPVVLYDQSGCGRSAAPADEEHYTLPAFVEDLHVLTSTLELPRFILLGDSWGGMLALAYAAEHPDRVASLVLSSPLVDVATWCADAARLVAQLPPALRHAVEHPREDPDAYDVAEREFYRRHFCRLDPWPPPLQRTMDELGTAAYETMWGPNEFTATGNLLGQDLTDIARDLQVPNLWLCGEHDEARPATIRRFAESNPLGRFTAFAGASHCVHLEQSTEYVETVRRFLADVPPDEGRRPSRRANHEPAAGEIPR